MIISKRNPLLRNGKETGLERSVGSLAEAIRNQDLESVNGGSSWGCAIGTAILYTVTQSIATQVWECGAVLTTSAECSRTGLSC